MEFTFIIGLYFLDFVRTCFDDDVEKQRQVNFQTICEVDKFE